MSALRQVPFNPAGIRSPFLPIVPNGRGGGDSRAETPPRGTPMIVGCRTDPAGGGRHGLNPRSSDRGARQAGSPNQEDSASREP
ncbi:hypothetical protein J2853_001713 [Streptosporangium lutulentum]|uniref:Uncharacterized protein n=1 Tax=Streptosporangium lutulentum TaxID=1461250 RepID=A0ABT9Q708_9ACTN|nr:hypothetical protein [Streptosporangium lutulentum]